MTTRLFDSSILATAQQTVEFVSNILESSTDYSIIGKDMEGKILLWNEGARRMYGYEAEEVVGKLNSEILHTPEDVSTGKPREIMAAALRDGKWEGVIGRVRKDGRRISARVVISPRHDSSGKPVGRFRRARCVAAHSGLDRSGSQCLGRKREYVLNLTEPLVMSDSQYPFVEAWRNLQFPSLFAKTHP